MCLIFPGLIHGMHEGELKHNGPFKASHHMVRPSTPFHGHNAQRARGLILN